MSTGTIQTVNLADNINAAFDKINENFELVETGVFSSLDSSSVTNIIDGHLDSSYFITVINEDYFNSLGIDMDVDLTDIEAGIAANASSLLTLTASINQTDSGITVLAQQQQATQAQLDGIAVGGIDSDTLVSALATANTDLYSRIDATDSDISVVAGDVSDVKVQLENISLTGIDSDVLISAIGTANDSLISRINADSDRLVVQSSNVTTLTAQVDSDFAEIRNSLQTIVDNQGNTTAVWNLDLNANNHIAGIEFSNDGATAEFALTADTFRIVNASNNEIQPFTVSGNDVYLSNATVTGGLNIGSNLTGAHMEMTNDTTKIYDENGQLRVQLGNLAGL